jgi:hypothetical protein
MSKLLVLILEKTIFNETTTDGVIDVESIAAEIEINMERHKSILNCNEGNDVNEVTRMKQIDTEDLNEEKETNNFNNDNNNNSDNNSDGIDNEDGIGVGHRKPTRRSTTIKMALAARAKRLADVKRHNRRQNKGHNEDHDGSHEVRKGKQSRSVRSVISNMNGHDNETDNDENGDIDCGRQNRRRGRRNEKSHSPTRTIPTRRGGRSKVRIKSSIYAEVGSSDSDIQESIENNALNTTTTSNRGSKRTRRLTSRSAAAAAAIKSPDDDIEADDADNVDGVADNSDGLMDSENDQDLQRALKLSLEEHKNNQHNSKISERGRSKGRTSTRNGNKAEVTFSVSGSKRSRSKRDRDRDSIQSNHENNHILDNEIVLSEEVPFQSQSGSRIRLDPDTKKSMIELLACMEEHDKNDIFSDEVSETQAPGYRSIIKYPMCFTTIRYETL